jgi:acyl-CoA thioester hydrolase
MSLLPPLPRDSRLLKREFFRHWLTERVRWSDTDLVGHVNNLSFSTYFETGRTEFLRKLISHDAQSRVLLLMAQMNVSFFGEVHWPAHVDVGTCVLDLGNSSCRLGHGLFHGEHCVASCDELLVLIDENSRKPGTLPAHVRNYLAAHMPATSSPP